MFHLTLVPSAAVCVVAIAAGCNVCGNACDNFATVGTVAVLLCVARCHSLLLGCCLRQPVCSAELLISACKVGDLVKVTELLQEHSASVGARDSRGWSPLVWAAFHGHDEVVALLLQHQADVDYTKSREDVEAAARRKQQSAAQSAAASMPHAHMASDLETDPVKVSMNSPLHWAAFKVRNWHLFCTARAHRHMHTSSFRANDRHSPLPALSSFSFPPIWCVCRAECKWCGNCCCMASRHLKLMRMATTLSTWQLLGGMWRW